MAPQPRFLRSQQMITQDKLRKLLVYDHKTGVFTWRINRNWLAKAGDVAGSVWTCQKTGNQYRYIYIGNKNYKAHRLAWLYEHGRIPAYIDHKDGNGLHNWIDNLREATKSQNGHNRGKTKNNTSGYKCVFLKRNTGKWYSQIRSEGRLFHKGGFETPELAYDWYCAMAVKLQGEFAITSRCE
jgi:hypothetical protein